MTAIVVRAFNEQHTANICVEQGRPQKDRFCVSFFNPAHTKVVTRHYFKWGWKLEQFLNRKKLEKFFRENDHLSHKYMVYDNVLRWRVY